MAQIIVLDYGFGNIRSVLRALEKNKVSAKVSNNFTEALETKGLIVPGVGAFAACMQGINSVRGAEIIDKRLVAHRPVLGICVGMQVMSERGIEFGVETEGLGQGPGMEGQLMPPVLPHMELKGLRQHRAQECLQKLRVNNFIFYIVTHYDK